MSGIFEDDANVRKIKAPPKPKILSVKKAPPSTQKVAVKNDDAFTQKVLALSGKTDLASLASIQQPTSVSFDAVDLQKEARKAKKEEKDDGKIVPLIDYLSAT